MIKEALTYWLGPKIADRAARPFSLRGPFGRAVQMIPGARRNFHAAAAGTKEHSWTTIPLSLNEVLRAQRTTLVARSRDAGLNNDYAKGFFGYTTAHVIGDEGMALRVRAKNADGTLDKSANQAIQDHWMEYASEIGACDVSGMHNVRSLCSLAFRTILEDGEVILRRHYVKDSKYGFQLQLIDSTLLDVRLWVNQLKNGNSIKLGIEYDPLDRPLKYYFKAPRDERNTGHTYIERLGGNYTVVPAHEIIHVFPQERIGQRRGYPALVAGLWRMRMLGKYEDSAMVKALVGSSSAGIIVSPDGDQYKGDDEDEDGNLLHDLEFGEWLQVPHGTEFKPWDPKYPDGQLPAFRKAMLQGMASGLLMSYPSLSADLEAVSFSSIRQGILAERLIHRAFQSFIAERIMAPWYRSWLEVQLLREAISTTTRSGGRAILPIENEQKFQRSKWQGYRGEYVNPLQDVMSHVTEMNNFLTSPQEVIRKRGRDPEDVQREWEEWTKWKKSLGVAADADATQLESDRTLTGHALQAEMRER